MDIGVFQVRPDGRADPAIVAKRAEELGFESYWVPDHTIIPVEFSESYPGGAPGDEPPEYLHQIPDPLMTLARASGATSTIKLGTGICLVPERNPILMAKQIATLDDTSGGRFLFGIGAGWNREECEILGGDFDHRWSQVRESIGIMKNLWTEDQSGHEGRYYNFPAVKCFPKPAQKPYPPIILGGVSAERVFNRVVDYGDGWMPLVETADDIAAGVSRLMQVCAEKGRDFSTLDITAFGLDGQWRASADRDAVEQAGANRLVVWLQAMDTEGILSELDGLAAELIGTPSLAASS